ncbi:hypothetical protein SODG_001913 [Sodalis praecaptivus]|nr:hypothetical protein NVIRENTERO_00384 [Sodalis praecaptivus]
MAFADANLAAIGEGDGVNDGQPQAATAGSAIAAWIQADKGLENPFLALADAA